MPEEECLHVSISVSMCARVGVCEHVGVCVCVCVCACVAEAQCLLLFMLSACVSRISGDS